MSRFAPAICLGILLTASPTARADEADRIRLFVLTDISSLTAGVAEPDDGQSLIRLLLHADAFDIEGLVASSNMQHGRVCRPELIRQAIDAYEKVWPRLKEHSSRFPEPAALRRTVKAGQPDAGPKVPVETSVGEGKDTKGSDWLIQVADRPDPRPLWVIVWGGSADLAQALWKVRATRSPDEARRFQSKLRVHSIGDQDMTGAWIKREFPDLYVITQQRAYRGMYRGGDVALASSAWVKAHARGHGALGDLYPDYNGGDIFMNRLGRVRGIKEGDTPSFLALFPNGLSDPNRPELGSWGGRFVGERNRLIDVLDREVVVATDPDPRMGSVHRWRPAFQNEFQARLDWCVRPYAEANHPPVARIAGESERVAHASQSVTLDATPSSDPDKHGLTFAWRVYPVEADAPRLRIQDADRALAKLVIAPDSPAGEVPVLLTVTDKGDPPLSRYARVRVKVEANRR